MRRSSTVSQRTALFAVLGIMPPSILLPARRGVPRPSRLLLGSRARGRKDICAKALGVNLAHVKSPIFRRKPKNILIVAGGAKTTPKRSFCSDDAAPPVIAGNAPDEWLSQGVGEFRIESDVNLRFSARLNFIP
jgi:hypothetical protein